jgi:hypothetical protein
MKRWNLIIGLICFSTGYLGFIMVEQLVRSLFSLFFLMIGIAFVWDYIYHNKVSNEEVR